MSNLSVNTITDASGGSTASINGLTPQASNMQPFNRIINGAMTVDQRNAGASVTNIAGNVYTLDRWQANGDQASKFTIQQNAASVTPPAGFINYLGITSSSAYSVGAAESFVIRQKIEGLNVADLGWGTAGAATVTLSFWVRSSLTGTFGGSISNSARNRSYPFSYTISTANTWEQKSVTIAGDTTGTWLTTTGIGIEIDFGLGVGTTYSSTAGSWSGATYISATGATSVVGTSGATFYITGVQLEAGSTASSFAHEFVGDTLRKCHRYFFNIIGDSTTVQFPVNFGGAVSTGNNGHFAFTVPLPQPMRADPTFTTDLANSNYQQITPSATQWSFYLQNQGWGGKAGNGDINTLSRAMNGKSSVTLATYYISPATLTSDQLYVGGSRKMWLSAEL
jgi:hypothetical protein